MARSSGSRPRRLLSAWEDDRGLSVLLALLFVNFLFVPLLSLRLARIFGAAIFSFVLVAGPAHVSRSRLSRGLAVGALAVAVVTRWLDEAFVDPGITAVNDGALLLFLVLLAGRLLRRAFGSGPVTAHRVRGAVAAYFVLGLCWATVYQLISLAVPEAFSFAPSEVRRSFHDASLSYFSFITLTTLGFGDITPVHPVARTFVILEALTGQLYPATLLARLVSLEILYRGTANEKQPAGDVAPGTAAARSNAPREEVPPSDQAPIR